MRIKVDQLVAMAAAIKLTIPAEDRLLVAERLSAILDEMDVLEEAYGPELDKVDPIPSVVVDEEALR